MLDFLNLLWFVLLFFFDPCCFIMLQVDVDALAASLRSGYLRGAAVDVYPLEPPGNGRGVFENPLCGCPNTILTPHIGVYSLFPFFFFSLSISTFFALLTLCRLFSFRFYYVQ